MCAGVISTSHNCNTNQLRWSYQTLQTKISFRYIPVDHTSQNGFVCLELLVSHGQGHIAEVATVQERAKVGVQVALRDLGEVVEGAGHCEGFCNHTHLGAEE